MKHKLLQIIKNNFDYLWLGFFIFVTILLKLAEIGSLIRTGIPLVNTLDFSWQTDNIERLLHGHLAGKDFIFTYGPLFQIIYAIPSLLLKQPSYIGILYAPILLNIINTILLFFIIKLTIGNKRTTVILTAFLLFIIDLLAYDPNSLMRTLLPFLYGILLLQFVSIKQSFSLKTLGILLLPALFGMYTFDLFILGFIITVLVLGHQLFTSYQEKINKQNLKPELLKGVTYFLFVGLFSILGSLLLGGNISYLIYSLDTVKNYQFVMSIPWSPNKYMYLLLFPVGLCLLLFFIFKNKKYKKDFKITLLLLATIALLQLKSGFIRSDDSHIIMGIYPSLIIVFITLFVLIKERMRFFFILLLVGFYLLIPVHSNYIKDFSIQNVTAALSTQAINKPFLSLYQLPYDYYYTKQDFNAFQRLISQNPGKVMIYPYDSYILNIFGTTFNTVALQFYQYANTIVEEKTVEELRTSPPKFIILGIDDHGAVRLDNISNFSRNSLIAKWMLQNYSVEKKTENYLILYFDPKKTSKSTIDSCMVYDIDTTNIFRSNLFERLIKSPTFYLDKDSGVRLPYLPNVSHIFIVENSNKATALEKLFASNLSFENYHDEKKKLTIIRKSPIPKISQTIEGDFNIKCYY